MTFEQIVSFIEHLIVPLMVAGVGVGLTVLKFVWGIYKKLSVLEDRRKADRRYSRSTRRHFRLKCDHLDEAITSTGIEIHKIKDSLSSIKETGEANANHLKKWDSWIRKSTIGEATA